MSYKVLPFDLCADRAGVLDLWRQNLPEATEARYAWLYESGAATGWVVKSESGAIVGATGLMGRTVRVFGEAVQAGQAIDLNVDKAHRTLGPALGLQRAVVATVDQRRLRLLYGFPIAQSEPVLRRCGYQFLGLMRRWAKPLRLGDSLGRRLTHPRVGQAAAAVLSPLLRLHPRELLSRLPSRVRVEATERFDERFDALWASARFAVVGDRSAAYLRWRFGQCPDTRHQVLCLRDADARLLAYLVYHESAGIAAIDDFFFAELRDFDRLLAQFLRRMRQQRAEAVVVNYLGSRSVARRLRRFGFWKRPAALKMYVYLQPRDFGPDFRRLIDKENWHVTAADTDVNG